LKPYCENQKDAEELRDYINPRNLEEFKKHNLDILNDWYAIFLREGDFEFYQQFCYMEDCKFKRVEKLRAMWILQRFNLFGSEEWTDMTTKINPLFQIVKKEWP